MRGPPPRPRGVSSSRVPLPPSSTGPAAAETSGAAADVDVLPPIASDDWCSPSSLFSHVGSCLDHSGGSRTDFGGRA